MKTVAYYTIPAKAQFQADSSVRFAIRSNDLILTHIDWLLERFAHRSGTLDYSLKRIILCDLFLTCNYWVKLYHEHGKRLDSLFYKERYPAVIGLFECVVNNLCEVLGCNRKGVLHTIDEMFGRQMDPHGYQIDKGGADARYLSRFERELYRLRFKGGLAYQYPWWTTRMMGSLQPADSSHSFLKLRRKANDATTVEPTMENFGGFVMTLERGIYMGKHELPDAANEYCGFYHSAYMCGERVSMAGTMLIRRGRVEAIRADSGHYKPTDTNTVSVLLALGMYGVDISRITIYDYTGTIAAPAMEFLKDAQSGRLDWGKFEAHRSDERSRRGLPPLEGATEPRYARPPAPQVSNPSAHA